LEDLERKQLLELYYPVIASYLVSSGAEKFERFKARYMFSRSVAVTFFVFGLIYYFHMPGISPDKILLYDFLSRSITYHELSLVFLGGSGLFMYSSGEYKYYFVEYFASEFIAQRNLDNQEKDIIIGTSIFS
jgi:hypothetical protein